MTKMSIPIETGVSFGNETRVSYGIHGIDFNLVFTSHKSSLFSGGIGVRALWPRMSAVLVTHPWGLGVAYAP